MDKVILVDEQDNEIGSEEKMEAHRQSKLHRCFSILIFNDSGELLLQQRAKDKYHCGGLWTNTCCSHPRPGEKLMDATKRRLQEEMGFVCEMQEVFDFIYKAKFSNELTEYEFDHVFIGKYNGVVNPNSVEVEDCKWISMTDLERDLLGDPDKYTAWFKIILEKYLTLISNV
ncbi:isopentenyl-diphosphate Delta-isomerase [Patescibacteria group bacterium]